MSSNFTQRIVLFQQESILIDKSSLKMSDELKPLIELERECEQARLVGLLQDLIYCPLSSNPYIVLKFSENTTKRSMDKIQRYIKENYDIDVIELSHKERTLYVSYDFWKRFPSD